MAADAPPDGSPRYDTVSFLSDYGHGDEFVGVVHSVIHQLAPGATVIDITHGIEPYDIRAAGLTLARSVQYLAPGVIMAVVDPGVGTHRRPIAVEVGSGRAVFIGPDNGLLAPAVGLLGGATRAVWLNDAEHQLAAPGPLFDGRDVFAPAAAHLCNGVPLTDLGEEVDTATLFPGILPISRVEDGALVAEVLLDGSRRTARRVVAFEDIAPGAVGLVVDSYGLISLAARQASAAEDLGIGTGDGVTLRPIVDSDDTSDDAGDAGDGSAAESVTAVRVTFGRRPTPSDPASTDVPGGAG